MKQPHRCWSAPPEALDLAARDVHVWKASVDLSPLSVQGLARTLSEDERARAGRFSFEQDRRRFIARRGVLRAILGRYLRMAPWALEFRYGPYGKPALSSAAGGSALRFNVSHADGVALYGVTSGREMGIDLERVRSDFPGEGIAERFFSHAEAERLRTLSRGSRPMAFFTCWTRKEAYVKAKGEGLSALLDQFDVSLGPGDPAVLVSTAGDPQEAARWSLQDLPAGPGYVAAVAVEGHDWRLQCWQW